MKVIVLTASGETDEWEEAGDAIVSNGELHVFAHIEGEEIPGDMKVTSISQEIPQARMEPGPAVKTVTYQHLATYAAGMWIRVEYQ